MLAPLAALAPIPGYTTLDVATSSQLMREGFFHLTLDVRRSDEYESTSSHPGVLAGRHPPGHIAGAYFIESLGSTGLVPADIMGCRDCNIAIYCRTGNRSKDAAVVLEAHGFTQLYDILGVTQWEDAGLPLVTGNLTAQPAPPCNTTGCTVLPPAADDHALRDALPWLVPLSSVTAAVVCLYCALRSGRKASARIKWFPA